MRAAAKVDEVAFPVEGNVLVGGNRSNDFRLVMLADRFEEFDRLVALPDFAGNRNVLLRQLGHAQLDRCQIFRRKGTLVGKIIVEAILDDRSDGHLGIREQFLDRESQQVSRRVPDHIEPIGIAIGHDGQLRVMFDHEGGIDQIPIDTPGERCLGQTRTDRCGDFTHGDCRFETSDRAVWQGDIDHDVAPEDSNRDVVTSVRRRWLRTKKKCGLGRTFLDAHDYYFVIRASFAAGLRQRLIPGCGKFAVS